MASQPVKKRTKRCSIKNPILSLNFPDDVVENILSFFSIKQAVRLSLLSKRFENSWRINRNLCFDNSVTKGRQRADVIKIINRVFDLHSGTSVNKFGLCFDPIGLEELLVNWIKRAVSKGVEELELDFKKCGRRYKLPSFIFSIESLGILKVAGCKLEVSPKLKGFHSLKALVLKEVEVTSGSLDVLLYKCLRLESLELVKCYPIFDGKIESENLKILRLESCYGNFSSISIDAPSLCSLHYDGCIRRINFSSKMQLLNDAILNFRTRSYRNLSQAGELILEVAYVNVLTVNGTFLEGLSPRFVDSELRGPQFLLLNLKEFNLSMGISHINPCDIVVFLENCPFVERIFIDLGDSSFENGYYWVYHAKEKFGQCNPSFERLKIIEVKGFKFRRLEIEMVKFFLEKARSLERLALVSSKNKYPKFFSQDVNIYELFLSWRKSPKLKIELFWR